MRGYTCDFRCFEKVHKLFCVIFYNVILIDEQFLANLVKSEYEKRSQKLCQEMLCQKILSSKSSTSNINLPISSNSQTNDCEAKDGS